MKIVFINLNSSSRDSENVKSKFADFELRIGDFIIYCEGLFLFFAEIEHNIVSFNTDELKLLEKCPIAKTSNFETNIIFQYDSILGRRGDVDVISNLISLFNSEQIKAFLHESIDILHYDADTFSTECLFKIYSLCGKSLDSERTDEYVFVRFFNKKLKDQYNTLQENGLSIQDTYRKLKSANTNDFSKALKSFKKEFPNITIYDKISSKSYYVSTENQQKKTFYRCEGFHKIYRLLEEKKLTQISDTDWIDENGNIYIIDIHPKE